MAKDDIGGVWRTIAGRRVFIKDGQSLESAMKESGKFKRTTAQINNEYEELSKKMQQDDYYYKSEDDRKLKELRAEYDTEVAKGRLDIRNGNNYLPKETKIETQGKSNRAEVSNNIQAHILDYYDNPVDFMEQMDAMDYLPTKWKAGEEIAKGGSYLIYNGDMSDFLDKLKINPKGKKFSEDKAFQMYTSLIGRESEKLYNKLDKLYQQYKAEHKNSDISLDDFRKWFK